jgi:hypothetical protein
MRNGLCSLPPTPGAETRPIPGCKGLWTLLPATAPTGTWNRTSRRARCGVTAEVRLASSNARLTEAQSSRRVGPVQGHDGPWVRRHEHEHLGGVDGKWEGWGRSGPERRFTPGFLTWLIPGASRTFVFLTRERIESIMATGFYRHDGLSGETAMKPDSTVITPRVTTTELPAFFADGHSQK